MCKQSEPNIEITVQGKKICVDRCIAPIVQALNDAGIATSESCCGHGEELGHIMTYHNGKYRLLLMFADGDDSLDAYKYYSKVSAFHECRRKEINYGIARSGKSDKHGGGLTKLFRNGSD